MARCNGSKTVSSGPTLKPWALILSAQMIWGFESLLNRKLPGQGYSMRVLVCNGVSACNSVDLAPEYRLVQYL